MTDSLTEFLRSCLDEDEQGARDVLDVTAPLLEFELTYGLAAFFGGGSSVFPSRHWPWGPDRVLAEIAAKRAILDHYSAIAEIRATADAALAAAQQEGRSSEAVAAWIEHERDYYRTGIELAVMGDTLLSLAQSYADRPGWSEDWAVKG